VRKIRTQKYRLFRSIVSSVVACSILMSMVSTTALAFDDSNSQPHVIVNLGPNGQSHFTHHSSLTGHLLLSQEELNEEETEETKDRLIKAALLLSLLDSEFETEVETYFTSDYGDEPPLPASPRYIRYCSLKIPS
jgi:hypothetical protein